MRLQDSKQKSASPASLSNSPTLRHLFATCSALLLVSVASAAQAQYRGVALEPQAPRQMPAGWGEGEARPMPSGWGDSEARPLPQGWGESRTAPMPAGWGESKKSSSQHNAPRSLEPDQAFSGRRTVTADTAPVVSPSLPDPRLRPARSAADPSRRSYYSRENALPSYAERYPGVAGTGGFNPSSATVAPQTGIAAAPLANPAGQSAPAAEEGEWVSMDSAIASAPAATTVTQTTTVESAAPSADVASRFDALISAVPAAAPSVPAALAPIAELPAETTVTTTTTVTRPALPPIPTSSGFEPVPVVAAPAVAEQTTTLVAPAAEVPAIAVEQAAVTSDAVTTSTTLIPSPTVPPSVMSEESKAILERTPGGIDSQTNRISTPDPIIIRRTDASAGNVPSIDYRTHEEMGLKIEVRRPGLNTATYLEDAYDNLMKGNKEVAIGYYNEVLKVDPNNETALFGLATAYHKDGRLAEARQYYDQLLTRDPSHREGLTNFLALVSDEAPQDAVLQLERLEASNPDFSPIPAQLGILYNKLGQPKLAAEKLIRALALSPDNISYKYNLAITLDKLGDYKQAADLYFELVDAYAHGEAVPGDIQATRERAIFLSNKGSS